MKRNIFLHDHKYFFHENNSTTKPFLFSKKAENKKLHIVKLNPSLTGKIFFHKFSVYFEGF